MRAWTAVSSLTLALAALAPTDPALARPCPENKDLAKRIDDAKWIAKQFEKPGTDLLFVFVDGDGKFTDADPERVALPLDGAKAAVSDAILRKAAKAGVHVNVYNRSQFQALFVPIAASDVPAKLDPVKHCYDAVVNDRLVGARPGNGTACEQLDLAQFNSGAFLYDRPVAACETLARHKARIEEGPIEKTSPLGQEIVGALRSLNNSFDAEFAYADVLARNRKANAFSGQRRPALTEITEAKKKDGKIGQPKTESKKKTDGGTIPSKKKTAGGGG